MNTLGHNRQIPGIHGASLLRQIPNQNLSSFYVRSTTVSSVGDDHSRHLKCWNQIHHPPGFKLLLCQGTISISITICQRPIYGLPGFSFCFKSAGLGGYFSHCYIRIWGRGERECNLFRAKMKTHVAVQGHKNCKIKNWIFCFWQELARCSST